MREIQTIDLETVTFETASMVSRQRLQLANEPKLLIADEVDGLVVRMQAIVAGRTVGTHREVVRVRFARPATWWDAFKAEHPRLCARLEPPRYVHEFREQVLTFKVAELFPDIPIPEGRTRVRYAELKKTEPGSSGFGW